MQTVTESYQIIKSIADKNSDAPRVIKRMQIGQVVRQGDIYIHRVEAKHPKGKPLESRQLAVGNSKGARHVAEQPAQVYAGKQSPRWCDTVLIGPRLVSAEPFTISHPEHPDICLPPGDYQITHQMDARTRQRVQD